MFFRLYRGLFSEPKIQFPAKKTSPSEQQLHTFAGLLQSSDLLTDEVIVTGTTYKTGRLVVTAVTSSDVIEAGWSDYWTFYWFEKFYSKVEDPALFLVLEFIILAATATAIDSLASLL